jgi:tyrosine-protein kinase Etk/Wzc
MAMNFDNRYTDVSAADELRLTDYLQAIVGNWRMIATITLAVTLLGIAYAFLAKPVYKADAVIQVEDVQNGDNGGGGGNQQQQIEPLSRMFTRKATTAAEMELLKSRLVTEATVRDLHLDIGAQPRMLPVIGPLLAGLTTGKWGFKVEPFMDLGGFAWGNEKIVVSRFDTPKAVYGKAFKLTGGPGGTFTLNDPDGIAIASGRIGEDVSGVSAAGPVVVHVDKLTGRSGTQFELTRFSTLDTVEQLQKSLRVLETALQSGIINVTLQGANAQLTADVVNGIARQFIQQSARSHSSKINFRNCAVSSTRRNNATTRSVTTTAPST